MTTQSMPTSNGTAFRAMYFKQIAFAGLLSVFVLTAGLAGAQTIDEYKKAVSEADAHPDGTCDSLPKENLRERCGKFQDFVTQDCKRTQFSCEGLGTKALAVSTENKSKAIEQLKQKKEGLERERSRPSSDSEKHDLDEKIADITTKIDNDSRYLEQMKATMNTNRGDSVNRAELGRRCVEARNDVQYLFKDALNSAKSETDAAKKDFANKLVDYWDRTIAIHDKDIETAKAAIEFCEKCKNGEE